MVWTGCRQPDSKKLRVATAANVQYAIEAIAQEFTQKTGIEVELIFGSSGKLTAQILQGAPFDLFISADQEYPSAIYMEGLTQSPPELYAKGQLVLWSVVDSITLESLSQRQTEQIAIPNPKFAPYGLAALEVLDALNLSTIDRLIFGESVSQTNHFIMSGSVRFGFTSRSTVFAPHMKGTGMWVDIPSSMHAPIEQALILLTDQPNVEDATEFKRFILSQKGKTILQEYGYLTP